MIDEQSFALILIAIAFVVLIVRSVIDAYVNRDVMHGYRQFVNGVTTNTRLSDALESRYLAASPEEKRRVDRALDLVKWLADLTPTDADAALKRWADEIRDGQPNTVQAIVDQRLSKAFREANKPADPAG